ncbi:MAG: hypothetical protein H6P98_28, partial [Candidatus Aminicenantes bacterium]|nr:hypothetical protein [Candidatus Aminicenantes bacterium]
MPNKKTHVCGAAARLGVVVAIAALLPGLGAARAQEIPSDLYKSLQYRHIGPQGNRVVAVAGIPG